MTKSGPRAIRASELRFQPRFAYGDQASVAEVSGTGDGTKLGTGIVRLRNADIPWTIKYDEVLLVMEGALKIQTTDGVLEIGPGDCAWLPNGTELRYQTDEALVFYAIHPSDWAKDAT